MSYFTFSSFPPQMLEQKARVLEVYLNQANGHFEIAIYARALEHFCTILCYCVAGIDSIAEKEANRVLTVYVKASLLNFFISLFPAFIRSRCSNRSLSLISPSGCRGFRVKKLYRFFFNFENILNMYI